MQTNKTNVKYSVKKDAYERLNSWLGDRKYRNGKTYVTIFVNYLDSNNKWQVKTRTTGLTPEQYWRDQVKSTNEARKKFMNEVADSLGVRFKDQKVSDNVSVLKVLRDFNNDRKDNICIEHYEKAEGYIKKMETYLSQCLQKPNMTIREFAQRNRSLKDFYNHERDRVWRGKTMSLNTLVHIMNFFHPAFKSAFEDGYVPMDITANIKIPSLRNHHRQRATIIREFDSDDITKFVTMDFTCRLDAVCYLDMLIMARRSEVLGLTSSNIFYHKKSIKIEHPITYGKGSFRIHPLLKNEDECRMIGLNHHIADVISWLESDAQKNRIKLGNLYCTKHTNPDGEVIDFSDHICVDEFGKLYLPNRLTNHIHILFERLKIADMNFHKLRSMGSSILDAASEDEDATLEALGDKTKRMGKVYIKPLSHKLKIANDKVTLFLDELKARGKINDEFDLDDERIPF